MNTSTASFSALMFTAGLGIPVMAAINAGLGGRIGNTATAVFILACVAVAASATVLFFSRPTGLPTTAAIPPIYFAGGLFFIFYISSITIAAPRIGLGNSIVLVLLGQLVAAATIDHFGLFGVPKTPVNFQRVLGLAVMAIGVALARKQAL